MFSNCYLFSAFSLCYTRLNFKTFFFFISQTFSSRSVIRKTYARTFSARDIAERSLQEMKRQTSINKAREADWTNKLAAVLPDVKPGDSLLGFHRPDQGAMFQSGGRTLGTVDDPVFSALFFGIWLSPATSEPALRTALIAQR